MRLGLLRDGDLAVAAVIVTGNGAAAVRADEARAVDASATARTVKVAARANDVAWGHLLLPSARGSRWRRAAGLLTRGSLPRRLPGRWASGVVAGEHLPSQRRDRPGLAPGSLTALRLWARAYHSAMSTPATTVPARPLRLAPRVRLGRGDLRLLLRAEPRHGSRDVGHDPAQARARRRVRDPRRAPAPRSATPWRRVRARRLYAVTDEVHQTFVEGRHGAPIDVAIDTAGVLIGVSRGAGSRAAAPGRGAAQ